MDLKYCYYHLLNNIIYVVSFLAIIILYILDNNTPWWLVAEGAFFISFLISIIIVTGYNYMYPEKIKYGWVIITALPKYMMFVCIFSQHINKYAKTAIIISTIICIMDSLIQAVLYRKLSRIDTSLMQVVEYCKSNDNIYMNGMTGYINMYAIAMGFYVANVDMNLPWMMLVLVICVTFIVFLLVVLKVIKQIAVYVLNVSLIKLCIILGTAYCIGIIAITFKLFILGLTFVGIFVGVIIGILNTEDNIIRRIMQKNDGMIDV